MDTLLQGNIKMISFLLNERLEYSNVETDTLTAAIQEAKILNEGAVKLIAAEIDRIQNS